MTDAEQRDRDVLVTAALLALAERIGTMWPDRIRVTPVADVHPSEVLNQTVVVCGARRGAATLAPFLARVSRVPQDGMVEIVEGPGPTVYTVVPTSAVWVIRAAR